MAVWDAIDLGLEADLSKFDQSYPNPMTRAIEPLASYTREMHEDFCALLDQPMCPRFGTGLSIGYTPTELENLILSEVEQYFNGQSTLDQCVSVIQERVSLYLIEQS